MQIRPAIAADLALLEEIDATIESLEYLHLERTGEGLSSGWKLEQRPLRSKLIEANQMSEDQRFLLKQIVTGVDEGLALVAEHEGAPVALALAQARPARGTMKLIDLRVEYDFRRQGIGTVLAYQVMQHAKDQELRAVSVETRTSNLPANKLMQKLAFEIAGIDTHRHSNHDMVKEAATVFWYAAMD
jgi:ribosomal protein S18 acetylase RimI-like enzyme